MQRVPFIGSSENLFLVQRIQSYGAMQKIKIFLRIHILDFCTAFIKHIFEFHYIERQCPTVETSEDIGVMEFIISWVNTLISRCQDSISFTI